MIKKKKKKGIELTFWKVRKERESFYAFFSKLLLLLVSLFVKKKIRGEEKKLLYNNIWSNKIRYIYKYKEQVNRKN